MRTAGTFQEVYAAAKAYVNETAEDGCPMDAVVRREEDRWMLESGMEPTDGNFEVSLEAFDSWFWEGYKSDYVPPESDIEDFVKAHQEENEDE